jgi:hypothetical protein
MALEMIRAPPRPKLATAEKHIFNLKVVLL